MNELIQKWVWRLVATFTCALASAANAVVQPIEVAGTGNPDVDVPAVQAAVAQGGEVVLSGHFSFDRAPMVPTHFFYPQATVLVSKAVSIAGSDDENGEPATIEAGTIPFYVAAPGASVTIQRLRFVRPKAEAIFVSAVNGLLISSCRIDGVVPLPNFGSAGIDINTSGDLPSPSNPGNPQDVAGRISLVDNDLDVAGGTVLDDTIGIGIWSVGVPGAEVEVHVAGNTITNFDEKGINIRRVVGQVSVERNAVRSDTMMGPAGGATGIFIFDLGSYLVARNRVHLRWATGTGFGIDVRGKHAAWPIEHAMVVDNDIDMDAPAGTVFGSDSAGVRIDGYAHDNVVLKNRIEGRARAGLSVMLLGAGLPANNAFVLNRFDDFEASSADVVVGPQVTNTLIVGSGSVQDQGVGTVIVPISF
jgi:hypothetical protein